MHVPDSLTVCKGPNLNLWLTLPDLSLLLPTTLSNIEVRWIPCPLPTHEPFGLTTSNLVGC